MILFIPVVIYQLQLLYPPPTLSGQTTLGHGPAADISIQGPGVAPRHCYIDNKCGVITLHPCGNLCTVDGLQVAQPVRLSQGRNERRFRDKGASWNLERCFSVPENLFRNRFLKLRPEPRRVLPVELSHDSPGELGPPHLCGSWV